MSGVKLYSGIDEKQEFDKTIGIFAEGMKYYYTTTVIEDEGRLMNYNLRDAFLTKLFAFARFRHAVNSGQIKNLIAFHSHYKYIFMTYDQELQKKMGQILAQYTKDNFEDIVVKYRLLLEKMCQNHTDKKRLSNALMHILGHFETLRSEEKEFFFAKLEAYKNDKLPLHGMLSILQAWAIRFDDEYIGAQALLEPYPIGLMDVLDSGKGRV